MVDCIYTFNQEITLESLLINVCISVIRVSNTVSLEVCGYKMNEHLFDFLQKSHL